MTVISCDLDLRYIDGQRWKLLQLFQVTTDTLGELVVPAGFITDFNSVPRLLWRLFPPTHYGEAAVAHDWLYGTGEANGRAITREQADNVHRELLDYRAAPRWRIALMFRALRWFGWIAWEAHARERAGLETLGADRRGSGR